MAYDLINYDILTNIREAALLVRKNMDEYSQWIVTNDRADLTPEVTS